MGSAATPVLAHARSFPFFFGRHGRVLACAAATPTGRGSMPSRGTRLLRRMLNTRLDSHACAQAWPRGMVRVATTPTGRGSIPSRDTHLLG